MAGVVGVGGVLRPGVRESCPALPPRLWLLILIYLPLFPPDPQGLIPGHLT